MFVRRSTYLKQKASFDAAYERIKDLEKILSGYDQAIRGQADTIRAMDQLIYQMGQSSSWESMRPYFNQLQSAATPRQRTESDRINNLLRGELLSVYAPKKETHS